MQMALLRVPLRLIHGFNALRMLLINFQTAAIRNWNNPLGYNDESSS